MGVGGGDLWQWWQSVNVTIINTSLPVSNYCLHSLMWFGLLELSNNISWISFVKMKLCSKPLLMSIYCRFETIYDRLRMGFKPAYFLWKIFNSGVDLWVKFWLKFHQSVEVRPFETGFPLSHARPSWLSNAMMIGTPEIQVKKNTSFCWAYGYLTWITF